LPSCPSNHEPYQERDAWASIVQPHGKYFLTRNASTIIAFAVGGAWKPGNPIAMVGAHTDSPCLRIKPVSSKSADGFLQVGVETYGGGLWHTWFDRDLSLAGRVMVRTKAGSVEMKMVRINRPILRIPTLAIHLDRQEKFEFNKEQQLYPISGLVAAELNRQGESKPEEKSDETESGDDYQPLAHVTQRHHPYLVDIIAEAAGCTTLDIVDFEMLLYDTQEACLGGLNSELIFSARLDNLMMSFCAVEGLVKSLTESKTFAEDPTIRLIALFDHEEIGSRTAQGADSNILPAVLRRLSVIPSNHDSSEKSFDKLADAELSTAYEQSLATSFLISADMAHSVHPNYGGKYEASHRPEMNKGVVIKINANARYATNSPGIVLLQETAQLAKPAASYAYASKPSSGVPLQLFVVRNDSSCGSTIGPMLSAALGTRTIDVGNAQLSMHSIRETGGAYDVEHAINLFDSFFENYGELESKILVD
jgi:aspartyl aminopeptidase